MFNIFARAFCAVAIAALISTTALAQDASGGPVRIISPFPNGTGPDVVARLLAEKMSKTLGQAVIVDARPGANGFIAAEAVKRAPADGHDLLLVDDGHITINPSLF